jgi:endonuclease-8
VPEGNVVHRLSRLLGATLADGPVDASSPQGRFAAGAALLDGERVVRSEAWGKYLFVHWTGGHCLHVHLGLIGKFRHSDPPHPPERPTIRLRLRSGTACWDLTGPTRCELVTPDERAAVVATLGADPLRRNPDVTSARERFRTSSQPVGALLLDQRVIAGLGNIYRAEILFLCGIDPCRPANRVSDDEFAAIWAESVRLLRIGVRTGRIITTDPAEIGRARSRMTQDDTLYVYHREHCRRCGSALGTTVLAGRPIQSCPTCQR